MSLQILLLRSLFPLILTPLPVKQPLHQRPSPLPTLLRSQSIPAEPGLERRIITTVSLLTKPIRRVVQ